MVVEQILFNGLNPEASLKALNEKYLNIFVEKSIRLEFSTIGNKPFTVNQILYGPEDILYPLQIREFQLQDAIKKDVTNCVSLEMLFVEVLGDIEYKGMNFDTKIWEDNYIKNLANYKSILLELDEYVLTYYRDSEFINKQYDLFTSEERTTISWTSSQQVIKFFKYLGICPQAVSKTTGNLSYTVNAKVLSASLFTMNKDIPKQEKDLILKYLKFKQQEQSCTIFGTDFFKYINPVTKRLHSNFRQILNTGRISSTNPNLQNIPASNEFRAAFTAPIGYKIVNADYSGQETVILANVSKESNIVKLILEGGDMHCFVVKALHPELSDLSDDDIKKHHKDKRQVAKAAGFAIQFGGNGHTISKNLGIPDEQGEEVYNAYFKAFPQLKNYFNKVQRESKQQGYILIDPITGRKSWFRKPKNNKEQGVIDRAALNFPIQGRAGSITKFAGILFRRWVLENNLQDVVSITNLVHDEINVEARDDYAELTARHLEESMVEAGLKWCVDVPLKADAVITDHWSH
jgi:DNA polymerase I-like protein with 3'-5' exonuclease and polymerase domains